MFKPATVLVAVLTTALFAQDRPRFNGSAAKKSPELWFVIGAIKKEASDAWRKGEPWPRVEPNFAAERGWTLPATDVARALTRVLDRERAVDAYIKTQLLSFLESFEGIDAPILDRVANTATKPVAQPVVREEWLATSGPGGANIMIARQVTYVRNLRPAVGNGAVGLVPEVAVAAAGTSLGVEGSTKTYGAVIQRANEKLEAERARVSRANEAVLAYRRALAARMPEPGGVRLAVMIKDAHDRASAGDPSTDQAVADLLEVTERLPDELSVSTRRALARWVEELGKVRTSVHDSVAPGETDKEFVVHHHIVSVRPEQIRTLLERLNLAGG